MDDEVPGQHLAPDGGHPAGGNQLGKRYRCTVCELRILCVAGGQGTFQCHGQPMEILSPKPLPASD
jgi:hypothetical protein